MNSTLPVTLKQKHFNERREFRLEPDRLRAYVKNIDGEVETFIEYETLTRQRRNVTKQSGWLYIAAVSFGLFGLVGFFLNLAGNDSLIRWTPLWVIASVIFFGFYYARRRRYTLIDLTTDQSLYFLRDKPTREAFIQFLNRMYQAQRSYVRQTYFVYVPGSDPDNEMRKLQWLLQQEFISETEFMEMKITIAADHGFDFTGTTSERILH
jgi:hypothetical protein